MLYAVEHRGLHRSVVVHVLEGEAVALGKASRKIPRSAEVAAEAGVAPKAVGDTFGSAFGDKRLVRHFERVGHMACKRRVDYCRDHSIMLHCVDNRCDKVAGAPCKGASRFENHVEIGMTLAEIAQQPDEVVGVVALACHEMSAAHVHPFQFRQEPAELLFKGRERLFEVE